MTNEKKRNRKNVTQMLTVNYYAATFILFLISFFRINTANKKLKMNNSKESSICVK